MDPVRTDANFDAANKAFIPTLKEKIAFLGDPRAYGPFVKKVDSHETHMSWVFLTEELVFKLKKPVCFPFLDYTTLEKRERACRAEVALNCRLAPDVYLGVAPLRLSSCGLTFGKSGAVVDWLVVMRRLDHESMLDRLILKDRVDEHMLRQLIGKLAAFYRKATPVFLGPEEYLRRWAGNLEQNRGVYLHIPFDLPAGLIRGVDWAMQQFFSMRRDAFYARLYQRRIVDGHGDLRPEHIWLGDPVKIIDCLEFSSRLRALDPLEEIAYLDLECRYLGAPWIGRHVRDCVMSALRDRPPPSLYYFYRCYRAMLRARLSINHLLTPNQRTPEKWRPQALSYLGLAAADARRLEAAVIRPGGRREVYSGAGVE